MGYEYEKAEALADELSARGIGQKTPRTQGFDVFDVPDGQGEAEAKPKRVDPLRPEPVRGRYPLPHPVTGKMRTWQRVSNLIKLADNTYYLERWKERNVAKGVAMSPGLAAAIEPLDVKADKLVMDQLVSKALDLSGAYRMSDEGTAIHASAELVDYAHGDIDAAPRHHRDHMIRYRDLLRVNGLTVVPELIERVVVSTLYNVAGKFDRVLRLSDGSYVMSDIKSGDRIDLALPSIAGQLKAYEDGVNTHGVYDGSGYDNRIKVRTDFGLVIHLPSTGGEPQVRKVWLSQGHENNRVCMEVRERQKVRAEHVSEVFDPTPWRSRDSIEGEWLEEMNAAHTVAELISLADRARYFGQWTARLRSQAILLSKELPEK